MRQAGMRRNVKLLLLFMTAWMFVIVYYLQTAREDKVITLVDYKKILCF